mmetsp:Transcript_18330/g.29363  ORF Transcript_18330/g.29363 Transcript_18330/m.29363 type:complete len:371 (+) Transcript_18330:2503-3615(+)
MQHGLHKSGLLLQRTVRAGQTLFIIAKCKMAQRFAAFDQMKDRVLCQGRGHSGDGLDARAVLPVEDRDQAQHRLAGAEMRVDLKRALHIAQGRRNVPCDPDVVRTLNDVHKITVGIQCKRPTQALISRLGIRVRDRAIPALCLIHQVSGTQGQRHEVVRFLIQHQVDQLARHIPFGAVRPQKQHTGLADHMLDIGLFTVIAFVDLTGRNRGADRRGNMGRQLVLGGENIFDLAIETDGPKGLVFVHIKAFHDHTVAAGDHLKTGDADIARLRLVLHNFGPGVVGQCRRHRVMAGQCQHFAILGPAQYIKGAQRHHRLLPARAHRAHHRLLDRIARPFVHPDGTGDVLDLPVAGVLKLAAQISDDLLKYGR